MGQANKRKNVSEWVWLLNITCNDISVIYVTAHRSADGLKKNFKSLTQRERLGKISSSISKLWDDSGNISSSLDHTYFGSRFGTDCDTSADTVNVPDIGGDVIVIADEAEIRLDIEWGKGRRIIELDVPAEGMRACRSCGVPLHLSNATGITIYGLASLIKGTGLEACLWQIWMLMNCWPIDFDAYFKLQGLFMRKSGPKQVRHIWREGDEAAGRTTTHFTNLLWVRSTSVIDLIMNSSRRQPLFSQ